jgi:SAM-dependent methyltransferase
MENGECKMKYDGFMPPPATDVSPFDAIRTYYNDRDHDGAYERDWGYRNPVAAAYWRMRDEFVFPAVVAQMALLAREPEVLEVGCGYGHELAKLGTLGIPQNAMYGIDLMAERIARAERLYPGIHFSEQDATRLSFSDESFDLVTQFVAVMHGLSHEMQRQMCAEMVRVLRPDGMILWWDLKPVTEQVTDARQSPYDYALPDWLRAAKCAARRVVGRARRATERSGQTSQSARPIYVNPISADRICQLFAGCEVSAREVGLDYEVWASLWPRAPHRAERLYRKGELAAHVFAVIRKR